VENEQARPLGVLAAFQNLTDFALRIKLCQDAPEPHLALAVAGHAVESGDHEHVAAVRAQETPHQVAGNPAGPPVIRTDIGEPPAMRDIVGERQLVDRFCVAAVLGPQRLDLGDPALVLGDDPRATLVRDVE
jgi:hypothetical protein